MTLLDEAPMVTAAHLAGSVLLTVTLAVAAGGQQPTVPVVLQGLDMKLVVNYPDRTIDGSATLTLRNHTASTVSRIPLQVGRLMEITSVADAFGRALPYTQNVVRFPDWPTRQMNQVWVKLASGLIPGSSTSVDVKWNGTITPYTETGMMHVRERVDCAFTIIRSETGAFPVVAVPSLAAMRLAPREEFPFRVRITVPTYEVAALGGTLASRTTSGSSVTYEYASKEAAPFVNIPIAPCGLIERKGVRVYYLPSDSAGASVMLSAVTRGLDLLATWFGPMGDTLDLAIMEIPSGYGSQSSLRSGIIQDRPRFRATNASEISITSSPIYGTRLSAKDRVRDGRKVWPRTSRR